MPPQTRSAAGRITGSSTRPKPGSSINVSTVKAATTKAKHKRTATYRPEKVEPKPSRKRARRGEIETEATLSAGVSAQAKPAGKLEIFMNMPLEIAKNLHPLELVLLSRVNRFFCDLFMSRRASPIWRSALLNVPDLPPCPRSLCEPQYAALLFTMMCSTCGKWAPRQMDAFLLVRLCVKCREAQAVDTRRVTDATLVFGSSQLLPANRHGIVWCLLEDAVAVKAKLNEFAASGDKDAQAIWANERRQEVRDRYREGRPLKEWLRLRVLELEAELEKRRGSRQAEIESRLLALGWKAQDISQNGYYRMKEWKSLVYNAKPLAWKELYPILRERLETNRKLRLKKEQADRRNRRKGELRNWLDAIRDGLEPVACAMRRGDATVLAPAGLPANEENLERVQMVQSFPETYDMLTWAGITELWEADTPRKDLAPKLDAQRGPVLNLVTEWRNTLEAKLLKLLPQDTHASEFEDLPGLSLSAGAQSNARPFASLPEGLQKLLRADAIFISVSKTRLYPGDFTNFSPTAAADLTFHANASSIAKTLLNCLGRPHASYLELTALGDLFQCERCHGPPRPMSWKTLVHHYLEHEQFWKQVMHHRSIGPAKHFDYVFTHDTDQLSSSAQPMVKIADKIGQAGPNLKRNRACIVCSHVNLNQYFHEESIFGHLRDVHLVEEPEEHKHYFKYGQT